MVRFNQRPKLLRHLLHSFLPNAQVALGINQPVIRLKLRQQSIHFRGMEGPQRLDFDVAKFGDA